jgi:Glycosyl hydrolases family 38 N-terminal domain
MALSLRALAALSLAGAATAWPCNDLDSKGPFLYSQDEATVLTFSVFSSSAASVVYNVTCAPPSGWATATAVMPAPFTGFEITFDESPPLSMPGTLSEDCTVISFGSASAPWCAKSNPSCSAGPPDPFWRDGEVHLVEASHSDVGWLGVGMPSWGLPFPDLVDDTMNIAASLDMMAADPGFAWQHECMLFMRCFVDMYPQREAELISRIAEGRFDIGGTFTEGLESTQLNELMARQMYTGRKWFVERYGALDSAVVAFHQDGPLRALQAPQVWKKSGMRYLKSSRWSDQTLAWCGADDVSCVLAMTEVHYGQANSNVGDIERRMQQMLPLYRAAGLPPVLVQALGTDYSPPTNFSDLFAQWAAADVNKTLPTMRYSTFKAALQALDVGAPALKSVRGERPNLWYIEGAPPVRYVSKPNLRLSSPHLPTSNLGQPIPALP